MFPFQNRPKYDGGKERTHGINFTFYCAKPERICKGIGERAHDACSHNGNQLQSSKIVIVAAFPESNSACKMRYRPKQKKNRKTARKGAHYVHSFGCCQRIISEKHDEDPSNQNKQWRAGWMRDLDLKTAAYEFTTIPKAASGFACFYVHGTGNKTNNPSGDVVDA